MSPQRTSRKSQSPETSKLNNIDLAKKLDGRLILGIDPGLITGVVLCTPSCIVRELYNYNVEEMYEFLSKELARQVQLIVMEEFILGARAAKLQGSRIEASSIIGAVQMWANVYKIPIVIQMPGIKTVAEKLSGKSPHGPHKEMHWLDAFNHVFYFLHSVGLIRGAGGKVYVTEAYKTVEENENKRQRMLKEFNF